jgi:uncharacterized protein
MLHGRTRDRNLSDKEFWPIFEAAQALQAPLYLHPQSPQQGVVDIYYTGFSVRPAGYWVDYEAGIQIVRLILAGVFDRFPDLKFITGHWGEVILFYLDRIDMLSGPANLPRKISKYVVQHIYVTASGIFSQRYLQWAVEVLGADHVLFATDYPFGRASRSDARPFLEKAQLSEPDRAKVAWANWETLCAGIRR